MTPIQQQAEAAQRRLNEQINRSAGQHLRAVRRVRAGSAPPTEFVQVDASQISDYEVVVSEPPEADEPVGSFWSPHFIFTCLAVCLAAAAIVIFDAK